MKLCVFRKLSEFGCPASRAGGDDGIRFSRELRARSSSVANVHRKFALHRFPFESAFVYNELSTSFVTWWRWWDSNPWPPACRAGALPAELHPHICYGILLSPFLEAFLLLVGPSGLEPPTSCLSGTRSNLLSYEPMWLVSDFCFTWLLFNFGGRFYSPLDWRCRHWAIFPYSLP